MELIKSGHEGRTGFELGRQSVFMIGVKEIPLLFCNNYKVWAGKTAFAGVTILDEVTSTPLYGWIKLQISKDGATARILAFANEKNGLPLKTGQKK
jgi:hypothetical protein